MHRFRRFRSNIKKRGIVQHSPIRHHSIYNDKKIHKTTFILALVWVLIMVTFGRSCGSEFLERVSANAALGLYNAVAEFFVPQAVYASEDASGGVCEDVVSSVIPALSYYNKVLWYEAQAEGDEYETLAAAENFRAQGVNFDSSDIVSEGGSSGGSGDENSNSFDDTSGNGEDADSNSSNGASDNSTYADGSLGENGSSSLSVDELSEIETMAQAVSDGSGVDESTIGDGSVEAGGSAMDSSVTAGRAAADGFDVLADLVKLVTVDREKLQDFDYLKSTFYQVDSTTSISSDLLDADTLLAMDMTLEERSDDEPQILIYHTHSQEGYADSVEGDASTTVLGVGEYLTQLLSEEYGYQVLHHTGEYDVNDRDHAYTNAAPAIEELLEEYPSIQVVIDLHRDGVAESTHLVTEINGKQTAQIMFFNGLSHTTTLGDISWLPNPYIEENLAFSLQMQLAAAEYYPGLTRRIYLKGYRYNMHFLPQSMLVEVGAQTNTVEEAMNAMEPLAALLDYVLSGASQ